MDEIEKMNKQHLLTSQEKIEAWGEGEWVNEPDLVEFEYLGYKCRIHRVFLIEGIIPKLCFGHLCGYVRISKDHSYAEKDFMEIDLDCHGGLTYARLEDDGFFWIGFDCAHSNDIVPSTNLMYKEMEKKAIEFHSHIKASDRRLYTLYRNTDFVINECKKIVNQLIEMENDH
jgi:hypothetical protein